MSELAASPSDRARIVEAAGGIIAEGSKSFRFASQLFSEDVREKSWLLYAWCRACDDITDGQTLGHDAERPMDPHARIQFVRDRTRAALAGEESGLVPFDALAIVAAETGLPHALTDDHLAGFERDAVEWRPESEEDLLSYCYQVAGAVGVMMAHVMGVGAEDRDTLNRAADLGIAFQLANIARDIVEDAHVGRTYVPRQWLAELGISPGEIADPRHRSALAEVGKRLADLADRYRESARVGAGRLPFRSRWAVHSAARIYGAIAEKARALGERAWDRRIRIGKAEKLRLVVAALWDSLRPAPATERSELWTRPIPVRRESASTGPGSIPSGPASG
ncbi:phytoene/squalene synthase family protein [Sphingomicrobium lutaoense]|uniref:Phytoene synthase n=1 Tax=Sphingomicrobium lutaoense TaxID=515949 RepID=A0A839Z0K7_9SPHN|nr:phytoene/squalene synthase family protein [Sphingomicrobium lutaoense]MBB3763183.1 phytoene synthase [Sphingomicrobium lutaoense]